MERRAEGMRRSQGGGARWHTGVRNLDAILGGGVPHGSAVVVSGPPGSGKTIFGQQLCFHNASAACRVLYFNTLTEPTAKALRYMKPMSFFVPKAVHESLIHFVDLGVLLRKNGHERIALVVKHIQEVRPKIVVIDSFRAFDDLVQSPAERRKLGYELAVTLMAWETTALLLGEYEPNDYDANPMFSIADGIIVLSQRQSSGEHQRFLRVVKMRGTAHSREEHPFHISEKGLEIYAPA
jgi:circadian clock protein KaiC